MVQKFPGGRTLNLTWHLGSQAVPRLRAGWTWTPPPNHDDCTGHSVCPRCICHPSSPCPVPGSLTAGCLQQSGPLQQLWLTSARGGTSRSLGGERASSPCPPCFCVLSHQWLLPLVTTAPPGQPLLHAAGSPGGKRQQCLSFRPRGGNSLLGQLVPMGFLNLPIPQ